MNDSLLWNSFKSGNKDALSRIYNEHVKYLIHYGFRICREQAIIEDCVQDLFVELWRKRNSLGDNDSIRKYLTVAFRRKLIRAVQKEQKSNPIDPQTDDYLFDVELDIEKMIVDKEISDEKAQQIKEAFQALSARQKEVIYLKFYEEKSYDEIAEIMDISYQSLRNLVSSGLRVLRKQFVVLIIYFVFLSTISIF